MPSRPGPEAVTTPEAGSLEERFTRLAGEWEQAVAHHSSSKVRYGHSAYQEITSLGEPVVPLLLKDLEANRRPWFAALKAITGADPVPAEDAGRVERMAEAWLRWGRESGYRW